MIHFDFLKTHGAAVAAISGKADGDCSARAAVSGARSAFLGTLGVHPESLVCVRQVHGASVVRAEASDVGKGGISLKNALADADAMITNAPGLPLGIAIADCVPVFIVAEGGRAAALVHAGRKGTIAQIACIAARALCEQYAVAPKDLFAVIGPSAGPCCYEVDEANAAAFQNAGGPVHGRNLDLWEANRAQLKQAGIPLAQILVSQICTICTPHFYSYRAGHSYERNLAVLSV